MQTISDLILAPLNILLMSSLVLKVEVSSGPVQTGQVRFRILQVSAPGLDLLSSSSAGSSSCAAVSYHLYVALQLADARSLTLGGANVPQVVDGDGRTDAIISLSDCKGGGGVKHEQRTSETLIHSFNTNRKHTDRCAPRQTLSH